MEYIVRIKRFVCVSFFETKSMRNILPFFKKKNHWWSIRRWWTQAFVASKGILPRLPDVELNSQPGVPAGPSPPGAHPSHDQPVTSAVLHASRIQAHGRDILAAKARKRAGGRNSCSPSVVQARQLQPGQRWPWNSPSAVEVVNSWFVERVYMWQWWRSCSRLMLLD